MGSDLLSSVLETEGFKRKVSCKLPEARGEQNSENGCSGHILLHHVLSASLG